MTNVVKPCGVSRSEIRDDGSWPGTGTQENPQRTNSCGCRQYCNSNMLYRKVFAAQANQLLWRGSGHAAWLPHPSLALGDHGCQAVCVWVCDSGANGSWTSEMHPRRLRAVEGFKIMIMEPARAALSSHLTGLPMLIPSNLLPEASNCFAVRRYTAVSIYLSNYLS